MNVRLVYLTLIKPNEYISNTKIKIKVHIQDCTDSLPDTHEKRIKLIQLQYLHKRSLESLSKSYESSCISVRFSSIVAAGSARCQ